MTSFRVAVSAAVFSVLLPIGFGSASSQAAEIDTSAEFAFVTDFASGKVLTEKAPDALMKPASMAKIMTVYVAFDRIADGSLSLDDTFLISEKAWRKGGSKTFVEVGKQVGVTAHGAAQVLADPGRLLIAGARESQQLHALGQVDT